MQELRKNNGEISVVHGWLWFIIFENRRGGKFSLAKNLFFKLITWSKLSSRQVIKSSSILITSTFEDKKCWELWIYNAKRIIINLFSKFFINRMGR